MELFILLAISVPIFYIYGLIAMIRDVTKKNTTTPPSFSTDNKTLLQNIITELTSNVSESPNKTIRELLDEYKKRFENMYGSPTQTTTLFEHAPAIPRPTTQQPVENLFSRWYSNNSINLLLYIGAFLIVSSAGIFISFQWETISGVVKSLLLTLVGVGFFGCGWYFYSMPKIKNAGTTFIGIAAILIPVIGSAWYTFVFKDAGIPVGVAWLLTSSIALLAYVSLALYMKGPFYAYASTISTFSLMLSLVNTMDLHKNFYLLASILASFILLILTNSLKKLHPLAAKTFSLPADLTSQVAMPITLVYGFFIAVTDNKLFSTEAVLSVFLSSLFYLVSYVMTKETVKLSVSQILFLVTFYLGGKWLDISDLSIYALLGMMTLLYCGIGYYFSLGKEEEAADSSFVISIVSGVILFFAALGTQIESLPLAFMTLFPIITASVVAWYKKNPYPLLITSGFFAIFVYIIYMQVLKYDNFPQYLGLLYLIHGVGRYILTFSLNRKPETQQVGHITIVSYSLVSLMLTYEHAWILLICTTVIAFMLFCTSVLQKIPMVSYLGIAFSLLSVFIFSHEMEIDVQFYPFIILGFSYMLFFASRITQEHLQEELRNASLITSVFSTMYFFFTGLAETRSNPNLERNALISSYGTTILFGIDYVVNQVKSFGYVTSLVGMATLLWQINYLGYTDALMYTTPIGLYFLALAFTRRLQKDEENEKALTFVGIFFLLLPPFLLSFGDQATKYSLILGIEAILMVFAGISLSKVWFRYAGFAGIVLAILPQTYSYILALPRWLVVGFLGMLFLTVAIFLLMKRKEE